MFRAILIIFSVALASPVSAQTNLVFAIPQEYNFEVNITNFHSSKPQTWQTRFENLPEGEYDVTISVTKPNSTYKARENFKIRADRGYEVTYFVIPYENGLLCRMANYYTLEQLYGRNSNGDEDGNIGSPTSRIRNYKGRLVMSSQEHADFIGRVKREFGDGARVAFIKNRMPDFYFYTDDILALVKLIFSEESRFQLAKFAYDHTIDKAFYYKLREAFFTKSYYDALETHIAGKKTN